MKKSVILILIFSMFITAGSLANANVGNKGDSLISTIKYHITNNTGVSIPWFYMINSRDVSPGNDFEASIPVGLSEYTFTVLLPSTDSQAYIYLNGTNAYDSNDNSFEIDTAANAGGNKSGCTGFGNLKATCNAYIVNSTYNVDVTITKK